MKTNIVTIKHEFDESQWKYFHDYILKSTEEKVNCNLVEMKIIFNRLPIDLKCQLIVNGMGDEYFGELLVDFFKRNEQITKL